VTPGRARTLYGSNLSRQHDPKATRGYPRGPEIEPVRESGRRNFAVSSGRPLARNRAALRAGSSRRHGSWSGAACPLSAVRKHSTMHCSFT
jgi:hypothetical protein